MHRQLVAAMDNGAVPDSSVLEKSGLRSTIVDLSAKTVNTIYVCYVYVLLFLIVLLPFFLGNQRNYPW